MEAKQVTIVLFLVLVAVLAVSGFLIYDALGTFPASPAQSGVGYSTVIPSRPVGAVGYSITLGAGEGGTK